VKPFCRLSANVPGAKLRAGGKIHSKETGKRMFKANYEIIVKCGLNLMEFKFKFSDKEYGSVKEEYLENKQDVKTDIVDVKI
jgi:hypothetical protein